MAIISSADYLENDLKVTFNAGILRKGNYSRHKKRTTPHDSFRLLQYVRAQATHVVFPPFIIMLIMLKEIFASTICGI